MFLQDTVNKVLNGESFHGNWRVLLWNLSVCVDNNCVTCSVRRIPILFVESHDTAARGWRGWRWSWWIWPCEHEIVREFVYILSAKAEGGERKQKRVNPVVLPKVLRLQKILSTKQEPGILKIDQKSVPLFITRSNLFQFDTSLTI